MNSKELKQLNINAGELKDLKEKGRTEELLIAGRKVSITVVTIDPSTCESAIIADDKDSLFLGKQCILRRDAERIFEINKCRMEESINDTIKKWNPSLVLRAIETMLWPVFPKIPEAL